MKLKYNFVVRQIGGKAVAVAVGKDNAKFNGMIKLNKTGELIFDCLKNDTTVEEITDKLCSKFNAESDIARKDVESYLNELRKADLIEE